MKIGILIKKFENLSNWELRIIDEIMNNPELELSLLIQDGRDGKEDTKSLKNKIKRLFKSKNVLGKLLFKMQVLIEQKILENYKEVTIRQQVLWFTTTPFINPQISDIR